MPAKLADAATVDLSNSSLRELVDWLRTLRKPTALLAGNDPQTAIHGELGPVQRMAWSDPFPLAQIKALAHEKSIDVERVFAALEDALATAAKKYYRTREPIEKFRSVTLTRGRLFPQRVQVAPDRHVGHAEALDQL